MPQIQFNDDIVWHDFIPDRAALHAGPWFLYLELGDADIRLIDHRVDRPTAGMKRKPAANPAPGPAGDSTGAGAGPAVDEQEGCPSNCSNHCLIHIDKFDLNKIQSVVFIVYYRPWYRNQF